MNTIFYSLLHLLMDFCIQQHELLQFLIFQDSVLLKMEQCLQTIKLVFVVQPKDINKIASDQQTWSSNSYNPNIIVGRTEPTTSSMLHHRSLEGYVNLKDLCLHIKLQIKAFSERFSPSFTRKSGKINRYKEFHQKKLTRIMVLPHCQIEYHILCPVDYF